MKREYSAKRAYGHHLPSALSILRVTAVCLCLFIAMSLTKPQKAEASCACAATVTAKGIATAALIEQEFRAHEDWLVGPFYDLLILPTLIEMTEQLSNTALTQVAMVGMFFDAKHQLERQLVLDQYYVDAVRDYQPSTALCRFGTMTTGLASSDHRANINQALFMERSLDRHLGESGNSGASASGDLEARIEQFKTVYCDPDDNNGNLVDPGGSGMCGSTGGTDPARYNKDIDYTRTMDAPLTLDINLTDTESTADEADIFALATNLFGYELLSRPSIANLRENASDYHSARAAIAKRSVAENSFFAVASEKAAGSGASKEQILEILEMLGYPDTPLPGGGPSQIELIMGENPSYYAQMEILTKKIYQDPHFITNLIDKPANIDRQKAAMQSFRLMQQRDFYNSLIRQEMVLSVMLEEMLYDRFSKISEDIGRKE